MELIPSEKALLFRLIDGYSRSKHQCFVSELFLSLDESEYIVCFRPTETHPPTDRYAHCYICIKVSEAKRIVKEDALTNNLTERFDSELPTFG